MGGIQSFSLIAAALVALFVAAATSLLFNGSHSIRISAIETRFEEAAVDRNMIIDMAGRLITKDEYRLSYGPNRLMLPCLRGQMSKIRQDVAALGGAFDACSASISEAMPNMPEYGEPELYAVFVTAVSSRLAPYGYSVATDWRKMGVEPSLNCAQHSLFVAAAIADRYPDVGLELIGVDRGPMSNHALVSYRRGTQALILDGTTSIVVAADIDEALGGEMISPFRMVDFYSGVDEAVEILRRNVRGTFRLGALRPEDVIYRNSPPAP